MQQGRLGYGHACALNNGIYGSFADPLSVSIPIQWALYPIALASPSLNGTYDTHTQLEIKVHVRMENVASDLIALASPSLNGAHDTHTHTTRNQSARLNGKRPQRPLPPYAASVSTIKEILRRGQQLSHMLHAQGLGSPGALYLQLEACR